VLQHAGAELSARETITAEQEQWGSFAQLAAEYETIAAAAQHDRWANLIRRAGLTPEQAQDAIDSDAFGPLAAELRRAEANRHDLEALVPRVVQARGFDDADDIASILHHRVAAVTARSAGSSRRRKSPCLIAALIPEATDPMAEDMRRAVAERQDLIEARATALLDQALNNEEDWLRAFGAPLQEMRAAATWRQLARTVVAYRDQYRTTGPSPLGPPAQIDPQKIDAARARTALNRAHALTNRAESACERRHGRARAEETRRGPPRVQSAVRSRRGTNEATYYIVDSRRGCTASRFVRRPFQVLIAEHRKGQCHVPPYLDRQHPYPAPAASLYTCPPSLLGGSARVADSWGVLTMLHAIPYMFITRTSSGLLAAGAPGGLNPVILLWLWNAFKFLIAGPVSLVLHRRVRRQAHASRRFEPSAAGRHSSLQPIADAELH